MLRAAENLDLSLTKRRDIRLESSPASLQGKLQNPCNISIGFWAFSTCGECVKTLAAPLSEDLIVSMTKFLRKLLLLWRWKQRTVNSRLFFSGHEPRWHSTNMWRRGCGAPLLPPSSPSPPSTPQTWHKQTICEGESCPSIFWIALLVCPSLRLPPTAGESEPESLCVSFSSHLSI